MECWRRGRTPRTRGLLAGSMLILGLGLSDGAQAGATGQSPGAKPSSERGSSRRARRAKKTRGNRSGTTGSQAAEQARPGDDRWRSPEQLDAPPREANDTPFMPAPRGQLRRWQHEDESVAPKHDPRARRVQFTIAPAYALVKSNPEVESESFRWGHRLHGFGVSAEFDLQLWRFLWLRAAVMYSAHPVEPVTQRLEDDQEVKILAQEGKVRAFNAALMVAYAVDIGRFMPLVEVGLGGLLLRTPATEDQGRLGGSCSEPKDCAEGLTCSNEICQPGLAAEFIVGLGVDIAMWRNLSWGVNIRYFVKMPQESPYVFPTHVMLSLRGGVRF